jgi:alkanesulfonate monooxygenase SsuD/methylene tetrahydromethanopterin reductase-like flavin-dependent oxidoreductase (luciferase family)
MTSQRPPRISFAIFPNHPVSVLLDAIEDADRLGFHGVYVADETYHRDPFVLLGAAAARTSRIRFAPDVTHVILRDPTLIVQAMATLDELTNGRAELIYSIGNIAMLDQYGIDWRAGRQLARLREAHEVMRRFLDEGAIDFQGQFYRYTGLFTSARPVQERMPILIGAIRGPRSFELAGEISSGMHYGMAHGRDAIRYAVDHVRIGAERAGRDWRTLDLAAWSLTCVAYDRDAARECARVFVALFLPAIPQESAARHGVSAEQRDAVVAALGAGDVSRAIELTTPEIADRLSFAGTAEDVAGRIRDDVFGADANHAVLALVDPYLAELFSGRSGFSGVPDLRTQLRLVHDRVMPAFAGTSTAAETPATV